MIEQITRAAAAVATQVSESRRGFLGRLGQAALVAAGFLGAGGLFAMSSKAQAGNKGSTLWECTYDCKSGPIKDQQCGSGCRKSFHGCPLVDALDSAVAC